MTDIPLPPTDVNRTPDMDPYIPVDSSAIVHTAQSAAIGTAFVL
jgi:hypothetical protein